MRNFKGQNLADGLLYKIWRIFNLADFTKKLIFSSVAIYNFSRGSLLSIPNTTIRNYFARTLKMCSYRPTVPTTCRRTVQNTSDWKIRNRISVYFHKFAVLKINSIYEEKLGWLHFFLPDTRKVRNSGLVLRALNLWFRPLFCIIQSMKKQSQWPPG